MMAARRMGTGMSILLWKRREMSRKSVHPLERNLVPVMTNNMVPTPPGKFLKVLEFSPFSRA